MNSLLYYTFLLFSLFAFYVVRAKYRYIILLMFSLIFIYYLSKISFAAIILSSLFNLIIGRFIFISKEKIIKQLVLLFGVLVNIFLLFFSKFIVIEYDILDYHFTDNYYNIKNTVVFIGFSFYTLQHLSYIIDIYLSRIKPENNILKYILFTSFFPKVISGPIEYIQSFMPQLNCRESIKEDLWFGFQRILLGVFKKLVIADRLSLLLVDFFDHEHYGLTSLVGIYIFTIQLYFDFSSYTDIAIGSARMFGINLKENFRFPLRASSISEFWRSWHISLIEWLKTYTYYPIVYNLRAYPKTAVLFGVSTTLILSGLWHGLTILFVLYGIVHAFYLSIEYLTNSFRKKLFLNFNNKVIKIISVFFTFNLISFSFIFFRSISLINALEYFRNIFSNSFLPVNYLKDLISPFAHGGDLESQFNLYVTLILTVVFVLFEKKITSKFNSININYLSLSVIILIILVFGIFNQSINFIYFQF